MQQNDRIPEGGMFPSYTLRTGEIFFAFSGKSRNEKPCCVF